MNGSPRSRAEDMKTQTMFEWYQILRQHYQFTVLRAAQGRALASTLASSCSERLRPVAGESE